VPANLQGNAISIFSLSHAGTFMLALQHDLHSVANFDLSQRVTASAFGKHGMPVLPRPCGVLK
jgi:hypothetical protein